MAGTLLLCGGFTAFAQQPTFRTGTRTVALYATVTDAQKRLVPDLTQEDFEILDNDKPQSIDLFVNEMQPITVVVMLDTSASMTGNLKLLEQAAEQFLIRLLPKDKGMVGAFNDKIEFFPATFTHDRDRLIGVAAGPRLRQSDAPLRRHRGEHGPAAQDRRTPRGAGVHRRRRHRQPRGPGERARAGARTNEVMIYAVGLRSDYFNGSRQVRSKPDSG